MPTRRREHWRWWGWLAAGLGCGVLIGLSIPPFGWWPLAWIGFAGIALLLPGQPIRTRALLGLGAGAGQYILGLLWVEEFSIPGWIALIVVSALYVTLAIVLVPTGRSLWVAMALPAAMVATEWARDRFPLHGFPLGEMALGQVASPLAPTLRLGGSLLLTAMAVLAGVAIAEVVRALQSWRRVRSSWSAGPAARSEARARTVAAVGLVVLLPAVVGIAAASPSGTGGKLPAIRVALVQGGGQRGTRAISTDPEVVFQRHLGASTSLQRPLDLVVWPEGVLQSDGAFTPTPDAAAVSSLAQRLNATVVVGVEQDVGDTRYINEVVAWGPDGRVVGRYTKNHLVPFGEYVPARGLIKRFFNLKDVPRDAVAGHEPGILHTPAGPLGVMISYEVFFDERARAAVRAGGQVLIVPTNTASYRSSQVPTQELAAARMRAWETGRWTLQVTPTGYSAVVGPSGRVVKRTPLDAQRVLVATVPREDGRTVYVVLGDAAFAIVAGLVLGLAWALARARARSRNHDRWTFPL
jgi:apolipoprotein N-acyltransferase